MSQESAQLTRKSVQNNLAKVGLRLPDRPPKSRGMYAIVRVGSGLAKTSALGPFSTDGSGEFTCVGEVGTDVTRDEARQAAVTVGLNLINALDEGVGLGSIEHALEVIAYIRAAQDFEGHADVADGVSSVFLDGLGMTAGAHARTVIGVATLPFGLPIVSSASVRLRNT